MSHKSRFQNRTYLREDQYRDSGNLGARARLHEQYASNRMGWFEWVLEHLALQDRDQVLECGCGPGWLWRHNLDRLPKGCRITLTDLSPGMVSEAQEALAGSQQVNRFLDADITRLPFEDREFDLVVANHMFYHVADRPKGLAEVKRVLRQDGCLYAATVGAKHMVELRDLRQQLFPKMAASFRKLGEEFSLENGGSQLASYFRRVELYRYENRLCVTDTEPIIDYLLSSSEARREVVPHRLKHTVISIQHKIDDYGCFEIKTDSGLFAARI